MYTPCKHKQKKAILAIEIAGKVEFRKINIIEIKSTTLGKLNPNHLIKENQNT